MKTELKIECCNCETEHTLSSEDFDKDVVKDPEIVESNSRAMEKYEDQLKVFETAKKYLEDYYEKTLKGITYKPTRTRRTRKLRNLYLKRPESYVSVEELQRYTFRDYDSVYIYDDYKREHIYEIPRGPQKPSTKDENFVICPLCGERLEIKFPRRCSVE